MAKAIFLTLKDADFLWRNYVTC